MNTPLDSQDYVAGALAAATELEARMFIWIASK
jgi:hypothetical protein